SRRGLDKDERGVPTERAEIERPAKDRDDERAILERSFQGRLKELLMGQTAQTGPKGFKGPAKITEVVLAEFTPGQWRHFGVKADEQQGGIEALKKQMDEATEELQKRFGRKVAKRRHGDELRTG